MKCKIHTDYDVSPSDPCPLCECPDCEPTQAPSKAERSEQPQESFKPFFKDVEGKSDAYIESIISGRQEWTVETICMLSCQSIVDLHNAELATVRKQGNFARVQELAKQYSELQEAIMGGTGAKAVATHEQLLEKVVTERQLREQVEEWKSNVLSKIKLIPEYTTRQWGGNKEGWGFCFELIGWQTRELSTVKQHLLSALAAIEKFKTYLELYFIKGVLRFDDGKDYRQVACELIDISPGLSLLDDFKKDTARLDWLENEPADVIFTFNKSAGHKFFVTNFNGKQSDKSSLREAIDEAMK